MPGFITMTHRDEGTLCEQYAEHTIVVSKKLTVEILSHQIELAFQTAWPCIVACIEDNAMDEAHGKLSCYCDQYQDAVKNTKSLQEQLNSKKECCHKAESKLYHLQKEDKIKESREKSLLHANGVSRSLPQILTLLSNHSARPPGSDNGATQAPWTFHMGERLHSQMLNLWRWALIWCSPLLGQSSRHQRPWCPPQLLCLL